MTQTWPPSPCVEDEEVALAKEHMPGVAPNQLKSENQPASSRGSVDQYPIIDDTHVAPQPSHGQEHGPGSATRKSGQEPVANTEKRFVLVPSQTTESEPETLRPANGLHRSKSTTQLPQPDVARGRPHVTRIHTDLGAGLDEMRTGQRRAPSPYSHTPTASWDALSPDANRKDNLLSPMHAHEARRAASVHPGPRVANPDISESDQKATSRRRPDRSRSRAARQSFSHSDRSDSEKVKRSRSTKRDESPDSRFSRRAHRYQSPAPRPGAFSGYTYTGQDHITPPATPKPNNNSARSSAVEQTPVSEQSNSRHVPRRVNTDSPNTSSAEDSHNRRPREQDGVRSARSRRSSRARGEAEEKSSSKRERSQRRDRPSKDDSSREQYSSDEKPRRGTKTPVSARTPLTMEGLLENAFVANQNKGSRNGDARSRRASPCVSPAHSPPQTPRDDRSPRDYFEQSHHSLKPSRQRSRPPSVDETHLKDLRNVSSSLLGVATLGASLAAKAIPALTRSNTSQSLETPSSGSQSRPSSGQRSRRPSPLLEESQPVYQSLSRTNSVTSRDDSAATRTTTYTVHEDRAVPKTAQYTPAPLEAPRTASRASSYSHSPDQPRPPAPFRAFSTTTTQGYQQPGAAPAQQILLSSPLNLEAGTALPNTAARPNSLPPCPRSRPVAGLHDWYTIRDMSFLNFCPSCMGFLGSTRFRDYFIPSFQKDPRQPIICAMSHPWLRVAWLQSIKQDRKDLGLIWHIAHGPPAGTKPCSGTKSDLRRWYHLTDPRTKRAVDNFDICSACVRNIDLIFPKLQFCVFDRPQDKKEVEKICNLNTHSRHFLPILNELERLSERSKDSIRHRDFQDFVDYIRRISRNRQCVKDTLLATQSWHFHPEIPELTICEECYEEVVWPLRDRPIARDVSKTLKLVPPLRKSSLLPGTSCQLYSERMRRAFHDAVSRNNLESLKQVAQYRYHMEHRLQEMHKLYEMDQQAGIDRRHEIEKNISIWKSIE
ncbi:hypothetical protein G647_07076 [Cladophialophora carrionii CBS 160.54]|uniref:Uncharacterized protein n=1 Tax=Cladophialophora carrionii CBS 160.54 TaxID=1279043 RepID=V9D1C1_9EURO|nr:uncharacterized protein G647_07076 [Cladophialophora carrionii CBS 160.54]ETI20734.1 hypothetical protein G647_07076 [Cladophialophora carrionii CBS 160.54]